MRFSCKKDLPELQLLVCVNKAQNAHQKIFKAINKLLCGCQYEVGSSDEDGDSCQSGKKYVVDLLVNEM